MLVPRHIYLQWHITERCNLHCRHCYQNPDLFKELPREELLKILNNFIDQVKIWGITRSAKISITGGEPLLRDDVFALLERCMQCDHKFFYGLLTNGVLIDKTVARKLADLKVNYVQISIEGRKKVNDAIRGKGSFDKALEACKLLKNEGIEVIIGFTVSKVNMNEFPYIVKFAEKQDFWVGLKRMVPMGRGKNLNMLSIEEMRNLWNWALERKKDYPKISLGCEAGVLLQDHPTAKISDCSAGYGLITVMPDGTVYPCRKLPIPAGNARKDSFADIYQSGVFQRVRNVGRLAQVCRQCKDFQLCQGGARCMAFNYFNSEIAPDPYCWRLFDQLPASNMKWQEAGEEELKDWWENNNWSF